MLRQRIILCDHIYMMSHLSEMNNRNQKPLICKNMVILVTLCGGNHSEITNVEADLNDIQSKNTISVSVVEIPGQNPTLIDP